MPQALMLALALVYPWLTAVDPRESLGRRIAPPAGFERAPEADGSFAAWLRGLPLLPGRPPVRLFDGRLKGDQSVHVAVVDIDVGRRDLQQCADAVMRLRAEYLFAAGRAAEISLRFTSGERVPFARWARGERPRVVGRRVRWVATARPDASHASLRRYLETVFAYAGSSSLASELRPADPATLTAGDVFIQGGFPGHAVLVLDTALARPSGRRVFLLGQSYMPAQQIHVLRNPRRPDPWYELDPGAALETPEWTFPPGSLRRF